MKNSALIVKPDSKDVTKVTTKSANSRFPIYYNFSFFLHFPLLHFLSFSLLSFFLYVLSQIPIFRFSSLNLKSPSFQLLNLPASYPHKIQISSTDNSIWAKKWDSLFLISWCFFFVFYIFLWMTKKCENYHFM